MHPTTIAVSRALQDISQAVGQTLFDIARKQIGFTLVVFTPDRLQFTSNVAADETVAHFNLWFERCEPGWAPEPELIRRAQEDAAGMSIAASIQVIGRFIAEALELVGEERVCFSLLVHAEIHPIYISTADRQQCLPVLRDLVRDLAVGETEAAPHLIALN